MRSHPSRGARRAPKRHRRSIRLKGYDYSRSGIYFATLCAVDTADRLSDFEELSNLPDPIRKPRSLGSFISGFKSASTSRMLKAGWIQNVSIWQRNYYEHIVRNEKALNLIRLYIQLNPILWEQGKDHFDFSFLTAAEIDRRLAHLIELQQSLGARRAPLQS